MILFKPDMKQAILRGDKTVTRRQGKKRWNVGAIHQCRTQMLGEPFARVRIVGVSYENYPGEYLRRKYSHAPAHHPDLLRENDEEGRREGFYGWAEFWDAYAEINGPASIQEPCWRVEFELVEVLEAEE